MATEQRSGGADSEAVPPPSSQAEQKTPPASSDRTDADPPQAGDEGESQADTALSLEDARKLRSEARNLRTRLKDAEAERDRLKTDEQKRKDAELSELEKAQKRADEAEAERDRLRAEAAGRALRDRFSSIAADLVRDTDAAFALIPQDQLAEKGELDESKAKAAIQRLLKDKPYLAKDAAAPGRRTNSADGGAGGGGDFAESGDMNTIIRRGRR